MIEQVIIAARLNGAHRRQDGLGGSRRAQSHASDEAGKVMDDETTSSKEASSLPLHRSAIASSPRTRGRPRLRGLIGGRGARGRGRKNSPLVLVILSGDEETFKDLVGDWCGVVGSRLGGCGDWWSANERRGGGGGVGGGARERRQIAASKDKVRLAVIGEPSQRE